MTTDLNKDGRFHVNVVFMVFASKTLVNKRMEQKTEVHIEPPAIEFKDVQVGSVLKRKVQVINCGKLSKEIRFITQQSKVFPAIPLCQEACTEATVVSTQVITHSFCFAH